MSNERPSGESKSCVIRCGIAGAIIFPICAIALAVVQEMVGRETSTYDFLHKILLFICYPVLTAADFLISDPGYGDKAIAYAVPIFAGIVVYLALVGFFIGLLLGWARKISARLFL
jgi:hypothetical protein